MNSKKLMKIADLAKILHEKGKAKTLRSGRTGLYNKIRYGLGHEIKDGKIYSCLAWLKEYDESCRHGRPPKNREINA